MAAVQDEQSILGDYPYLAREDIHVTLAYAAALAEEGVVELAR
ncbi:MAG: hypothetical protein ABSD48_00705 [Armatimonadota bacterium]